MSKFSRRCTGKDWKTYFWLRVAITDNKNDCWLWKAGSSKGYGTFSLGGKGYKAHRLAWIITMGDIPDGYVVCHKCDNRACCNPNHLFLGTQLDNVKDMKDKGRASKHIGEEERFGKLNRDQVRMIREEYEINGIGQRELAIKYGVNRRQINNIVRYEDWKYI